MKSPFDDSIAMRALRGQVERPIPVKMMLDSIIDAHQQLNLRIRRIYISGQLYEVLRRELAPFQIAVDATPAIPPAPKPSEYKGIPLFQAEDVSFQGSLRQVSIAVDYEYDFQ